MNRAALLATFALMGGGLWLYSRRAVAAPAPGWSAWPEIPTLDTARAWVGDTLAQVESAARDVVSVVSGDNNLAAFLLMLRRAEGTADQHGYYTLFGGGYFEDFSFHPQVRFYEKADEFVANGVKDFTTAAGAYQITYTTYKALAARLGVSDFYPDTQDRMAVELIRDAGALELVRLGRFDEAVGRVAKVWASLPGGNNPQPKRSIAYVRAAYESAGGAYV